MRFSEYYNESRKVSGGIKPPQKFLDSIKKWVTNNLDSNKPVLSTDVELDLSDYDSYIRNVSLERLMNLAPLKVVLYNYKAAPNEYPIFKDGREGSFFKNKNRLVINTSALDGVDKSSSKYKSIIRDILTTVDHELMHWVQYYVLSDFISKDINRSAELLKKIKNTEDIETALKYYSLNPIELGPISRSAAMDLSKILSKTPEDKSRLYKVFTGQVEDDKYAALVYPTFFQNLKQYSLKSWKKAIKIFDKELESQLKN